MSDIERLRHDVARSLGLIYAGGEANQAFTDMVNQIDSLRSSREFYFGHIAKLMAAYLDRHSSDINGSQK